jgi:hypothetical protein
MPELSRIDPRSAALPVMDCQVDSLTGSMVVVRSAVENRPKRCAHQRAPGARCSSSFDQEGMTSGPNAADGPQFWFTIRKHMEPPPSMFRNIHKPHPDQANRGLVAFWTAA